MEANEKIWMVLSHDNSILVSNGQQPPVTSTKFFHQNVALVNFASSCVCLSVCLSVCLYVFPHDILKTDAARITKRDTDMVHQESWKLI